MFNDFFLDFEQKGWLTLALLVLPAYLIARRSLGGLSSLKVHTTFAVRAVVIMLLAMALARPVWLLRGEGLTVMLVVDRSSSIPLPLQLQAREYLRRATELNRQPSDRLGVVAVASEAVIAGMPNTLTGTEFPDDLLLDLDGTNLDAGIRLALASFPRDTASRIVLVSDGNENIGVMTDSAQLARANNIPIDVLPLTYEHQREVIFDRLVAPARAREGQVTTLRMVLRAQHEVTGTLTLTQNNVPVDLDPDAPGYGVRTTLEPGLNTRLRSVLLDQAGPQRFEARFEPDDPNDDTIAGNNSHVAVTFVAGQGRILVIDESASESLALQEALRSTGLSVDVRPPDQVTDPVMLAGYDGVVLVNVPRYSLTTDQDGWLRAYVHDLGGGLLKIGGDKSFGAGGWIGSEVAKALPLDLDPPQMIQRQRGALVLIMHSCEIPQANYWSEQIAIAAINALSRDDYVGIIDYNWSARGAVWEFDAQAQGPALAGDKQAAIAAARAMPVGDMPDFQSSMVLAYNGLVNLTANKHVIIISDGDPSAPSRQLLNDYAAAGITITTIMVAGHGTQGDLLKMQNIAAVTGGRFYEVTNPRELPEIFIEEAQVVARSLIVEDGEPFNAVLTNPLTEPARGFSAVPSVDGYVLTSPREGLAEVTFVSDRHEDPLFAHWNYGLGKAAAYTSDLTGRWGGAWLGWDDFRGFWDQTVRWMMRPATPSNMVVNTRVEGDRAIVEVEAMDQNASFLNFLNTAAIVVRPDGTEQLTMQQVGPGRYRSEFTVDETGAYLVNVSFSRGGEAMGNVQAAISVPYPREYRDLRSNEAELRRIAELTGGRILPTDPTAIDLFDRSGLEVPRSHRAIWDLLAILAASIFIVDVAARRLSIGMSEVRSFLRKTLGRGGVEVGETTAAWKKAKSQVAHRRDPRPGELPDRSVKFEADPDASPPPLEVQDQPATKPARRDAERPAAEEDSGDEKQYTSRLLAAKRRARDQGSEDKNQSGKDGA